MYGFSHHHQTAVHQASLQQALAQHETMQHYQQATQTAHVAHQQLEAMHQEAVRQHFQALLSPQPVGQRFLSFGRFVFAVLDLLFSD